MFPDRAGRKAAGTDLLAGEERLREFLASLPGMAYRCEYLPEWPMLFVSEGSTELTGFTPDELVSGSPNYRELIHPEDRRAVQESMDLGIEGESLFRVEYRIITRQGEERHVWEQGREASPGILEGFIVDITPRKMAVEKLKRLEWMLSAAPKKHVSIPPRYGDLTALNTNRTILDSVGRENLESIASDYMDLLGTSTAVYEVNGDYAMGVFTSGWCSFLDNSSRRLCETLDDSRALASGRWLCHESCWTHCAKAAIETGEPVEISCNGGLTLYGVPIVAGEEVVGAINAAFGDPPTDSETLDALAAKYGVEPEELAERAAEYESRPPYIVETARRRLMASARLIGEIVERNRAQSQLQNARQLLQSVLDTIPVRVFWKDLQSTFLGCNMPFARDAGLTAPEELIGKNDFQMGWRDQAELYRSDDLQVMRSGVPKIGYEEPQTTPEGKIIWLRTSKIPIRAPDGSVTGILGTYEEITGSKRADQALRDSEAKLKALFSAAPIGLGIVKDRVIVEANQAFCDMFLIPPEEMAGKSARDLYPSDEEYEFVGAEKQSQLAEKGVCNTEVTMRRGDGELLSVLIGVTLLDDSDPSQGEVFAAVDITRRKQSEELLRLQAAVLDQISDRVTVTDLSGNITYVNTAEVESLGYSVEEFMAMNVSDYGDDRARGATQAEILKNTLKNGHWRGTVVNRTRSGEEIILDCRTQIVRGEDGTPLGLCGISTDITDRVREEEEKERLRAQFLHAQKLESIGRLAGGVAHDFNHMLGVILGHADMMAQQLSPESPLMNSLTEIRAAADRSARLTRQLLGFARKQAAQPRVIDLNSTLARMLSMLRRLIGENIQLRWLPGRDLWKVKIDPDQLNQVLANLVVNARDAIEGEGTLQIRTTRAVLGRHPDDADGEAVPGDYVMMEVSDTGCGISENHMDYLFEPFFTTKEVGKGTGLGLATVFGIVSQNRGAIKVLSEPGQGAAFRVYLPRVEQPLSPSHSDETATNAGGSETILIVEDERMILGMASEALMEKGYRVLAASRPGDALELAAGFGSRIHLLITDMVMPGMNGRVLSEGVSRLKPGVKTLYMSGYTDDVIAAHGVLDEGLNFLQKPFSLGVLLARVRKILDEP